MKNAVGEGKMKKCSKCGELKDETEFGKCSSVKSGLKSKCKECIAKYQKENAGKIAEHKKEYYKKNIEKIKKHQKEYRKKNVEKIKTNNKEYRKENAKNIKERRKEYLKENAKRIKEQEKEYRKKNAKRIKEQKKEYNKTNPQAHFNAQARRRAKIGDQEITKEEWLSVMKITGWKCFYCDCSLSDKKIRTVDHIIPLVRGGQHHIDNLVPCCRKCNSSKKDKLLTEWKVIENLTEEKYEFLARRIIEYFCTEYVIHKP